ncbi:MAG TPA: hypothetical protein VFG63_14050 [Nocardioidaceae bacterium]|nr:hypothetical protein [Nocardioidaceae bacterium]
MNDLNQKDELVRELHQRSQDVGGHPIGLDAVKHSARGIRRRRRVVTGTVAAAVLAVAVPAGMAVTGGLHQSSPDPVAPGPKVTRTATPQPKPKPVGEVTLTTDGLSRSGEPRIGYVYGSQIIQDDGTATEVDQQYADLAPYAGGWIGLAFGQGEYAVTVLDQDGDVTGSSPGGQSIAVTSDRSHLAYFESSRDGGVLTAVSADGGAPVTWEFAAGSAVTPVGMLGADTVVYEESSVDPVVMVATPDGRTTPVPGLMAAGGASDAAGLISGQTESRDDGGSCWAVVDPGAKNPRLWDTCDFQLGQFSPDGRYLLASAGYGDGLGASDVAILDARTGEPVVDYTRAGRDNLFVHEAVWEDDSHVLASVFRDGEWTMVRMDLEGSLSAASPAVPGDEMSWPFEFSARP